MNPSTIQRPGNCPCCGYWDPFHTSWYHPDKEVADPKWIAEWDGELLGLLTALYPSGVTIQHADGDWWYHVTKNRKTKLVSTVERFPVPLLVSGPPNPDTESSGRTWRNKDPKQMKLFQKGRKH